MTHIFSFPSSPLLPSTLWPQEDWGANYSRLKQIKAVYDLDYVFSNPQVGVAGTIFGPGLSATVVPPIQVVAIAC
jgi:hypothetical protein